MSSVCGSTLAAYLLTGYTAELPTYLGVQFRASMESASLAASEYDKFWLPEYQYLARSPLIQFSDQTVYDDDLMMFFK